MFCVGQSIILGFHQGAAKTPLTQVVRKDMMRLDACTIHNSHEDAMTYKRNDGLLEIVVSHQPEMLVHLHIGIYRQTEGGDINYQEQVKLSLEEARMLRDLLNSSGVL